MEKIAVRCDTREEAIKVCKKSGKKFEDGTQEPSHFFDEYLIGLYWSGSENGRGELTNDSNDIWYKAEGYKIISAQEYLKGGGDVEFKVGDLIACNKDYPSIKKDEQRTITRISNDKYYVGDVYLHKEDMELVSKTKNESTKKENDMKRVKVILINRANDAVIYSEEMSTNLDYDNLKVRTLLDKAVDIKKSLKGEDVDMLHWSITTITEYDKPEVK